jgi:transposase
MKAYSEDPRRKIVDAVERGMPKAEAARTFGVGISTVKRYATKAQRGESLAPGKAPGKRSKMDQKVSASSSKMISLSVPLSPSNSVASMWRP